MVGSCKGGWTRGEKGVGNAGKQKKKKWKRERSIKKNLVNDSVSFLTRFFAAGNINPTKNFPQQNFAANCPFPLFPIPPPRQKPLPYRSIIPVS